MKQGDSKRTDLTAERRVGKSGSAKRKKKSQFDFKDYLLLHRHVALEAWCSLWERKLNSIMTWMVLAIALVMPALFYVLVLNISQVSLKFDASPQLSAFLKVDLTAAKSQQLLQKIKKLKAFEQVNYISPRQALQEFQQGSGMADVISSLDKNPLPGVIVAKVGRMEIRQAEKLKDQIKQMSGVDKVKLDLSWIRKLKGMINIGANFVWLLSGFLACGVLLIVGNTIRMAIDARYDEILVTKLVGGSNAYIRRPFLYLGFWFGFGSGFLAILLVNISIFVLNGSVERLATLYLSDFSLHGLGFLDTLSLLLISSFLGWAGAWFSSTYHLSHIEPK